MKLFYVKEHCCKKKYLNVWKQFWNWVMNSSWESFEVHARNTDGKAESGEVSDGNEEHVIGNEEAKGAGPPCRALGVTLPI